MYTCIAQEARSSRRLQVAVSHSSNIILPWWSPCIRGITLWVTYCWWLAHTCWRIFSGQDTSASQVQACLGRSFHTADAGNHWSDLYGGRGTHSIHLLLYHYKRFEPISNSTSTVSNSISILSYSISTVRDSTSVSDSTISISISDFISTVSDLISLVSYSISTVRDSTSSVSDSISTVNNLIGIL